MEHYEKVMVALSQSIFKNCLKRPQAVKSRSRDILFVIKARNHASQIKKILWITIRKSWSLSDFHKKQQTLIQKTYQFINVVNGVSHSHKTANIFFSCHDY